MGRDECPKLLAVAKHLAERFEPVTYDNLSCGNLLGGKAARLEGETCSDGLRQCGGMQAVGLVGSPTEHIFAQVIFKKLNDRYPTWKCRVHPADGYRQAFADGKVDNRSFILVPRLPI
jgi:hypothetical protein